MFFGMLVLPLGTQTSIQIVPLKTFEEKNLCGLKGVKRKV